MQKEILRLAIPNILTNLTVPLLGCVDLALAGHLPDVAYMGAVAVGSSIFNVLYWALGFLRMGTNGITAQAFGREDNKDAIQTLMRALIMAVGAGIVFVFLQNVIAQVSFYIFSASPDVELQSRSYFHIRIWAAPATLALLVFHGWFLGMQNAKDPLIVTFVINGVNLILNVIFVQHLHWGVEGLAWATLVAQYLGLGLCLVLWTQKYFGLWRQHQKHALRIDHVFDLKAIKRFFDINADIFLRTLCLIMTMTFFTIKSAQISDVILAVNSVLFQLMIVFAYGVDGFAYAAESIVGKYIGARDKVRLQKAIYTIFVWGFGLGVVFAVVYGLGGSAIVAMFTDQVAVRAMTQPYLMWVVAGCLINTVAFVWDGVYIGATATKALRQAMMVCTFIVFFPAYYVLFPLYGNHGLWMALTLFMIARALAYSFMAKKSIFGIIAISSASMKRI